MQIDAAGKYGNHQQRQRQQRKRNRRRLFALRAPLFLAVQLTRVPEWYFDVSRAANSLEMQAGIRDGRTSATATATQIKKRRECSTRDKARSTIPVSSRLNKSRPLHAQDRAVYVITDKEISPREYA